QAPVVVHEVPGHDGVVQSERPGGDVEPAALGLADVPGDGAAGDRRAGAGRLNAAAVADRRVADEGTVQDDEGALVVLVAEAAADASGEVVGHRAVAEGDGAVAGVADAAADVVRGHGHVAADQAARDGQVGRLEDGPVLDGVQPDAGALVDRGVAGDAAEIDEDPTRAVLVNAAAGVAGLVVADRAVVDRQRPGRADGVLEDDAAAVG